MRVLVVEDDPKMAALLRRGLVEDGHGADVARTGDDAIWMAQAVEYDAIVLDLMLPGRNGFEVCRELRADGVWSPVLMLTARDAVEDRVAGLDAGADDYLVKPFSFSELLARIRALLRRPALRAGDKLVAGEIAMDLGARIVMRGTQPVMLTPREFAVLEYLLRHPGQALSRAQIAEGVWSWEFHGESNIVDVYIGYLRRKLDAEGGPSFIETLRGYGYRLKNEVRSA
jgi:two-component system, OmpR family, response regulator